MGAQIFATVRARTDDVRHGAAKAEQSGVNPAGTKKRAHDFSGRPNRKLIGIPAEVDFPAIRAENSVIRTPALREPGEQPEADGLMGILRRDLQTEPRVGESAELAERGDGDRPVAAGGFLRSMIDGHFRQDEAGERLKNVQGEQSHAGRIDSR